MSIEDLRNSLQQAAAGGSLSLKQMAGQSYGLFMASTSVPLAGDINLTPVTVSDVAGGKFTVQGTGTWGLVSGVGATVTFDANVNAADIVATLLLKLPASFSLKIPNVDWIALGGVSLSVQSKPRSVTQNPLVVPVSGALSAVITLNGDIPVPIKVGMAPSGDWFVEGDFEFLDFPSLSSILSFVGNTDGINLPPSLDNLTRIALYDVSLGFNIETKAVTSVGVAVGSSPTLTDGWEILPGVFTIDSYKVAVNVVNPTNSQARRVGGSIAAKLTLGGTEIDISAAHPLTGGWDFQGQTGKDQNIDIGKLFDDLAGKFDVTLPASLKSLTLKNFSIGFNTQTGRANTGFTLDFKVSDTAVELTASLVLTKKDGKYTPDLKGTLVIGSSTFKVTFHDSTISAEWTLAEGAEPLEFGDLAAAFGFKDIPTIPPSLDLALTEASFTYDFAQSELMLTAISKNYGKAIFITQKGATTTLFAFGLNIHLGITLASIPLVGDKLPDAENLGISDASIWILSQPVMKAQAGTLNTQIKGLGGGGVFPTLPDADTTAKVLLSAALQLGAGSSTPLQLSLGSGQTPVQQGGAQTTGAQGATAPAGGQGGAVAAGGAGASGGQGAPAQPVVTAPAAPGDNTKWIDVQRQFGVFQFKRIGINYQDDSLLFALDAAVTLGPLTFSMTGLTVGSPLTKFQPTFDLSGLGIAYVKPPVEIMGAILKVPKSQLAPGVDFQFDGVVVIKTVKYSISGIASYAQMHGDPSLFVFAQLEAALGGPPAFFITGLMAGFGFNRKLELPAQDEVADFPLLALGQPPAPGQQAQKQDPMHVLDILEGRAPVKPGVQKAWIKPSPGDYWLAAGIQATHFGLVNSKMLLVVEFGNDFQVALLGLATMQLPQAETGLPSYVYVQVQLMAVLRPQDGFFGLTAILSSNSFLLAPACHLTGGLAFYLWFGPNDHAGEFVVTLGGYHPAFKPPPYYPQVPRLGFNWAVSDVVTVKGDAYFALTPSCVMAGGGLEVLFHSGDLRAWFTAHADLLISWHPFFFLAHIDVDIGVSYRLNLLFCHKTISVSIGASVDLWGPPTGGRAHVHLSILSFTVSFGADEAGQNNTALGWNDFKSLLPAPADVCKVSVSSGLYKTQESASSNSGKAWVVRATNFSYFTQSAIPASHLSYGAPPHASAPAAGENDGSGANVTHAADAAAVDIRPMNLSGVTSTHNLSLFKDSTSTQPADVSSWSLKPRHQNVPDSLWGAPPEPFTQIPDKPSAKVIPQQLVGYEVQAPPPAFGPTRGVVPLSELSEELVVPPGAAPISTAVSPSPDYLPGFDDKSIGLIQALMQQPAKDARDALYGALSGAQVYAGANGALDRMAANAAHLFSDPPMKQS